jgi:hypothetical protein
MQLFPRFSQSIVNFIPWGMLTIVARVRKGNPWCPGEVIPTHVLGQPETLVREIIRHFTSFISDSGP